MQSFTWASCMFSLHFCLLIVSSFASKTWICIHSLPVALFLISPVPLFWPTQSFYWYFPLAPGHPCSLHGTLRFPLFLRRLADCCVDVWSVRERSTLAHFFFYVAGTSTVKKKKKKSGRQPGFNPATPEFIWTLAMRKPLCAEDRRRTFTQHTHACECARRDNVKISTPFIFFLLPPPPPFFFCSSGSRRVGNEEITALVNSPSERCDMLKCNDLACWTETEHCFKPQRCRGWEPREKRGTEAKVSYPN